MGQTAACVERKSDEDLEGRKKMEKQDENKKMTLMLYMDEEEEIESSSQELSKNQVRAQTGSKKNKKKPQKKKKQNKLLGQSEGIHQEQAISITQNQYKAEFVQQKQPIEVQNWKSETKLLAVENKEQNERKFQTIEYENEQQKEPQAILKNQNYVSEQFNQVNNLKLPQNNLLQSEQSDLNPKINTLKYEEQISSQPEVEERPSIKSNKKPRKSVDQIEEQKLSSQKPTSELKVNTQTKHFKNILGQFHNQGYESQTPVLVTYNPIDLDQPITNLPTQEQKVGSNDQIFATIQETQEQNEEDYNNEDIQQSEVKKNPRNTQENLQNEEYQQKDSHINNRTQFSNQIYYENARLSQDQILNQIFESQEPFQASNDYVQYYIITKEQQMEQENRMKYFQNERSFWDNQQTNLNEGVQNANYQQLSIQQQKLLLQQPQRESVISNKQFEPQAQNMVEGSYDQKFFIKTSTGIRYKKALKERDIKKIVKDQEKSFHLQSNSKSNAKFSNLNSKEATPRKQGQSSVQFEINQEDQIQENFEMNFEEEGQKQFVEQPEQYFEFQQEQDVEINKEEQILEQSFELEQINKISQSVSKFLEEEFRNLDIKSTDATYVKRAKALNKKILQMQELVNKYLIERQQSREQLNKSRNEEKQEREILQIQKQIKSLNKAIQNQYSNFHEIINNLEDSMIIDQEDLKSSRNDEEEYLRIQKLILFLDNIKESKKQRKEIERFLLKSN